MPALRPERPAPGFPLILPRVSDMESTQRAFDQLSLIVRQVQALLAAQRNDIDAILAIASAGSVPVTSDFFDTYITPPQITGTVNDWNIGTLGTRTLVFATSDASRTVNGLVGGADKKIVCLLNVNAIGGNTPSYSHESGSATLGNRFRNGGGASKTGGSSGAVWYFYDGGPSTVWRNIMDTQ